jgi:TRAP-type uncharacterized transport system substrate-binding protein
MVTASVGQTGERRARPQRERHVASAEAGRRRTIRLSFLFAFLLALTPLAVGALSAQTRHKGTQPPKAPPFSHHAERGKVNENLVMLLGGTLGGPWLQMAQDISTVVGDGDNLRILPVAGGGGKSNLRDILLLRGVDIGITRVEVLNDAKASGELGPNLDRRIAYISALSVDMLQVLARPEINSLKDLHGKRVNILPKGSVVPLILKRLGIEIEEVNLTIPDGIEQMRTGKAYATACICSVPIPAYRAVSKDLGFKLLEVPYIAAFEESYLPASLSSDIYPNLIAKDSKVPTIGASLLLVTYNWAPGTERYRRLEKFVNAFFTKFDNLRKPPRHPTWRDVNLSANVRGWLRFPASQQWLDRQAAVKGRATVKGQTPGIDHAQAREQAAKAAPGNAAEQERLFKEFLEWSRNRPRK